MGWSRSLGSAQAPALQRAVPMLSRRGSVLTSLMLASYVGLQEHPAVIQVRFHSVGRRDAVGGVDSNGLLSLRIFLVGKQRQAAGGEHGRAALGIGPVHLHRID